jgi:hypothetical protein
MADPARGCYQLMRCATLVLELQCQGLLPYG